MFHFVSQNQDHGESVYNMGGTTDRDKKRLHVSRFACKVRRDANCVKIGARKTFGSIRMCPSQPNDFLKKFSRAKPCFWKYENPAVSCLPRICKCCHKEIYSDDECLPRAQFSQSQSDKCHNINYGYGNSGAMTCRASYSQPFLSGRGNGRTVSCQTEGQTEGNWKEPYCSFECDDYNGDCDSCPRYGDEIDENRCTCPRSGQGDCRPSGIYNGPIEYIDRGYKNFIRDNFLSAVRSAAPAPRVLPRRQVIFHKGDTTDYVPEKIIGTKCFGRVPNYLAQIKEELCQKDLEEKIAVLNSIPLECRQLSFNERCSILEDLQLQWQDHLDEFNRLPIATFRLSPRQAKLKVELETTLNCIEKDIELITQNRPLLVGDVLKSNFIRLED